MSDKVHLGHRARKRFGQNFLHDDYIIESIVNAIHPLPGDNLIEIGPGLAALTEPVAERAGHLNVVELDKDLAERLENHPELKDKLSVNQGDAMKFDFRQLDTGGDKKMRIFGNLPYNVSTPLMFHLFEFADRIQDMHFMLQKEVVNRLCASPGGKNYGRLTVMAQYYCKMIPVLEVPPESFKPAPKVDSAVVRLVPHETLPYPAKDLATLERVCKEGFSLRRKTIRNVFKQTIDAEALESLGINPSARPENLALKDFVAIANYLVDQKASGSQG